MKIGEIPPEQMGRGMDAVDQSVFNYDLSYSERAAEAGGHVAFARLDRDEDSAELSFRSLDRKGLRSTLDDVIDRQGQAAVLDFGDTTGNELYALLTGNILARHDGFDVEHIAADIVSGRDCSYLAERWRTRAATLVTGIINYEVQDLRRPDLPEDAYDLIFSFDGLANNYSQESVVNGLVRALRPGGTLFFNVTAAQESTMHPLMAAHHDQGSQVTYKRDPKACFYTPRHWQHQKDPVSFKLFKPVV